MRKEIEHVILKGPYQNHYIFHRNIRKQKLRLRNYKSNKVWMVLISKKLFFLLMLSLLIVINYILKLIIGIKKKKLGKINPKKSHPLQLDLPEASE